MLWKQLENSTKIAGAYEQWRTYRTQLTNALIEEIEIGDTIAILGAGACNDIDLFKLLPYINQMYLIDYNKEALQKAVEQYQIPENRVKIIELDLWSINKTKFEEKLNQGIPMEQLIQFLKEETSKAMEESLLDCNVDMIINIGLYSQLNTLLVSLFYLKREPYALSEREQLRQMFSYMNQQAVTKINDWIVRHCKKAMIGYEYAVFETDENGNKQCNQVMELLRYGQVEILQSMAIARVEGGWQGESDLARRYRKQGITLDRDRYFIWNFIPQKQYIMQIYTIRPL